MRIGSVNGARTFVDMSPCAAPHALCPSTVKSLAQEWHRRIVGGALQTWLWEHGPHILQERATLAHLLDADREPSIVFTGDAAGLLAAEEIVGPVNDRVAYLLEEEFAAAEPPLADPGYVRHVHVWSRFLPNVDAGITEQARARYPIPSSSEYWQHAKGTMWGVNAGRGVNHLWRWDGREMELLEEAMAGWVA